MKKYCFNYSVEGVASFLPMYACVCAPNSKEAYKIAKKHLVEQNKPRKVDVYKKPFSPKYANPTGADYADRVQTIGESCLGENRLKEYRMSINYVAYFSEKTGRPVKGYLGHVNDTTVTVGFNRGEIIEGELVNGHVRVPIDDKITVFLDRTDVTPVESEYSNMNGLNEWFQG